MNDVEISDDLETGELPWLGAYLSSKGISHMEVMLAGGGDSGQIETIDFFGDDDQIMSYSDIRDDLMSKFIPSGSTIKQNFFVFLESSIYRFADPFGDYCNNEGGVVNLEISVTKKGLILESGTFSENEYDDEYDDEDYEDDPDEGMEP